MIELQAYEHTDIHGVTSWTAEPVLRRVRRRYGDRVWWRRVYGSHPFAPSPDRECQRWLAAGTGAPLAPRLERLPRSPQWAARAARAAEHQGAARAEAVLRRLREATFVDGRPVDGVDGIRAAVAGVHGLDVWRLVRDLSSPDVVWSVDADAALVARRGGSLPAVLYRGPCGDRFVNGPLEAHIAAAEAVAPGLRGVAEPEFDAEEALEQHRSLTLADLEGFEPPARAVRLDTATVPLWLHPDEAEARWLRVLEEVER